jgi:hypothetical protein
MSALANMRCIEMLAAAIARLGESAAAGASEFEQLDYGVAATLHADNGDRYRVSVEWIGDNEGEA